MKNQEYISVQEFARQVNITPQAVYKQLDNKLKGYWQLKNGKKLISVNAFELFENNQVDNNSNNELTKVVELLTQQLKEKDKQIEGLNEALKKAQQLTDQAQQLQAQAEHKVALLEAPKRHWWQKKTKIEVVTNAETNPN